ncbi:MAG: hypothetical protein COB24_11100 [Hyphomicrobiales bacterium]|nr:MAG: hypothetical protein COB24_11100 [Hyphomicrobiales bacterium]
MGSAFWIVVVLMPLVYLLLTYVVMFGIARYWGFYPSIIVGWLIVLLPVYYLLNELRLCLKVSACDGNDVLPLWLLNYIAVPLLVFVGLLMTWHMWYNYKKPKLNE